MSVDHEYKVLLEFYERKTMSKKNDEFITFDKFAENGILLTHPINIKRSSIEGFEEVVKECVDEYKIPEEMKKMFIDFLTVTKDGARGGGHIYCLYFGGRTIFINDMNERLQRLFGKPDYNP